MMYILSVQQSSHEAPLRHYVLVCSTPCEFEIF